MSKIAYFRVSTADQSIESQREAMGGEFDEEFSDQVSGSVLAKDRPGFASLLDYVRKGDVVYVYSVDRLGRDALDVQSTVRALIQRDVAVHVRGLGEISQGVGELVLAVLAQVADMERRRIMERTRHGREVAQAALIKTGLTHRGKESLGRPFAANPREVAIWRQEGKRSIAETADWFNLSPATVKRYSAKHLVRAENKRHNTEEVL